MNTIRMNLKATVSDDRRIVVTLPPEIPTGEVDLELIVTPQTNGDVNGTGNPKADEKDSDENFCLSDWFRQHAEHWGDTIRSDDVEGFTGRRF